MENSISFVLGFVSCLQVISELAQSQQTPLSVNIQVQGDYINNQINEIINNKNE